MLNIYDVITNEEKPVELDDATLRDEERLKEFILFSIRLEDIKESLAELKGITGKEATTLRKELNNEKAEISSRLPDKNDSKKIKDNIPNALKKVIEEGIFLPNEGKRKNRKGGVDNTIERTPVPIRKVRVKFKSNTAQPLKRADLRAQLTPNSWKDIVTEDYQYIEPGNNFMFVIYGDEKGEGRDKHIVSWFDKAQIDIENARIKKQNRRRKEKEEYIPYFPIKKIPVLCTLEHNDMVLMFDESPDEINWDDDKELFNRLFTLVKFTENQIIFMRHNVSGINANDGQSVTNIVSGEGHVKRPNANTFRGIKVKIDLLGIITKI
jgi:hypothetical protein